MLQGRCETANNALKEAAQAVKRVKPMRIEERPSVESAAHYKALDTVTRRVADLERELSNIMQREGGESDSLKKAASKSKANRKV